MISTTRRLEFASGYLALGMIIDASNELESIEGEDRLLPEVLTLRCDLYTQAKYWDLLLAVGRQLAWKDPKKPVGWISWGFALRELGRVEEARGVLLEAEPLHGAGCSLLHYNLACYYCLLGDHVEARKRVARACRMESSWKATALEDADLAAMWEDIAAMD